MNRVEGVVEIVVQMKSGPRAEARVKELAGRLGVGLEPLHPGTGDPSLAPWYHAVTADENSADALVEELLGHADVEAAYVKPPGSAP